MTFRYFYEKGKVAALSHCPGAFCGREWLPEQNLWSECGACNWGSRANKTSACIPCSDEPTPYDWFYLSAMALAIFLSHTAAIDTALNHTRLSWRTLVIYSSALTEVIIAGMVTVLLIEPTGTFSLTICRQQQLADWYTIFHNPTPNYQETLYCAQEAVYPLYSMVFIFLAVAIVLLVIFRPLFQLLLEEEDRQRAKWAIYAALYFIPIMAVLHAMFAGLIYLGFPYVFILWSITSNGIHLATQPEQNWRWLLKNTFTNGRYLAILALHCLMGGFGIVSVSQFSDPVFHGTLLVLVPMPTLLYIAMVKCTDPKAHHE
uniref:EOG090X0BGA n=1 Tax=Lynceus sp. MCZ IZ 141354 TaxID=1930659 RepID=A0A9N6WW21_9CRUS|nr:EOG090X0BGA [Lynceus sp. MCZ IZ 141354]